MAALTCAHWLLNVQQVSSLTQPLSPINQPDQGQVRLLQPAIHTHTHSHKGIYQYSLKNAGIYQYSIQNVGTYQYFIKNAVIGRNSIKVPMACHQVWCD